jgi:uncharacterized protein (TIGR03435 family)
MRGFRSQEGLVLAAYHLNAAQFTADRWMESTWFRIQAKAPPGATEDQFRIMEQNLLAERFKLSAHFEKREVVNYEMTVTAGGPKFLPGAKQSGVPSLTIGFGINGAFLMMGDAVSMDQLASFLSHNLDWPVVDATGLSGFYKLKLDFEPPQIESVRDQLGLILERTKTVMYGHRSRREETGPAMSALRLLGRVPAPSEWNVHRLTRFPFRLVSVILH